ncbi:MAG TPA: TetR/AcrR family transcriptional regulator [Solirubrobacteraceae bacterium]|nr:TetR/AcrR family transcriptional regulator [Solirubrobacteraceae bacterium]
MSQNAGDMDCERKPMRADAERNRQRLIAAATEMFCARGLEVGVGEIAEHAGVGRGTLFRNFPTKEHLIAAIVVQRMGEMAERGRARLHDDDPGEALFTLLNETVGAEQQTDRALFEALDDEWMDNEEIRAGHAELMAVLDALVARAQEAGTIRSDVTAIDVLCMTKGVCEASRHFAHLDPGITARQLELVRAALTDTSNRWPVGPGSAAAAVSGRAV